MRAAHVCPKLIATIAVPMNLRDDRPLWISEAFGQAPVLFLAVAAKQAPRGVAGLIGEVA